MKTLCLLVSILIPVTLFAEGPFHNEPPPGTDQYNQQREAAARTEALDAYARRNNAVAQAVEDENFRRRFPALAPKSEGSTGSSSYIDSGVSDDAQMYSWHVRRLQKAGVSRADAVAHVDKMYGIK